MNVSPPLNPRPFEPSFGATFSRADGQASTRPNYTDLIIRIGIAVGLLQLLQIFVDPILVPDWKGYEVLYLRDGGWLREANRDPLFVQLLSWSVDIFGVRGYETFRLWLFGFFNLAIVYFAFTLPKQRQLGDLAGALCIGTLLGAAFLTKSLVQVREGIAFVILLFSLGLTLRWTSRWMVPTSLLLTFAALAIHIGLSVVGLTVVGGWFLTILVDRNNRMPSWLLWSGLAVSLLFAAGLSRILSQNPDLAFQYFGDLLSAGGQAQQTNLAKLLYWFGLGGCCVLLFWQTIRIQPADSTRFGVALAFFIGCILLPIAFAVPFSLAISGFQEASVIASLTRLLFTVMQLAALFVVISRRATFFTILVNLLMIVDQTRTMLASIGP